MKRKFSCISVRFWRMLPHSTNTSFRCTRDENRRRHGHDRYLLPRTLLSAGQCRTLCCYLSDATGRRTNDFFSSTSPHSFGSLLLPAAHRAEYIAHKEPIGDKENIHFLSLSVSFECTSFNCVCVCVCVEACVLYVPSVVHAAYSAPFLHAHIFFCVCVAFVLGCIIGRLCISSISDHLLFNFFPLSFSFLCAISFVRLLSCDCLAYIL